MQMDKYEFILDLLHNNKLTLAQKEEVLQLASKEIKYDFDIGNKLEFRITRIEKEIFKENSKTRLEKKHAPREMVAFLFQFSINEKFKWFTHKADQRAERINYMGLLKQADKHFRELNYQNLNIATIEFIKKFILKNELKIKFPEYESKWTYGNKLIQEYINHGMNPFEIKLDNVYFSEVIDRFKRAIEFRHDNLDYKFNRLFRDFITDYLPIDFSEEYKSNFDISAQQLSTYIDVNNFFRGLEIIMKWIENYKSKSNKVIFNLIEKVDFYELEIFHVGSYFSASPDSNKVKGQSGDLDRLRKYWFSIVDLIIYADFYAENQLKGYKINCLTQNTKMVINSPSYSLSENEVSFQNKKVGGIKYLIMIYKNK